MGTINKLGALISSSCPFGSLRPPAAGQHHRKKKTKKRRGGGIKTFLEFF